MIAYITTCCKEKRTDIGKLPAIDRYISERINSIYQKSITDKTAFYILSGKYGLLSSNDEIGWYDKILETQDIPLMTELLNKQINKLDITEIILFVNKKWTTYIEVIERVCIKNDIKLKRILNNYKD